MGNNVDIKRLLYHQVFSCPEARVTTRNEDDHHELGNADHIHIQLNLATS